MLMRIVPRSLLSRGLQERFYGPGLSFSFASIGPCAFHSDDFLNCSVKNLFHVPRIPPSPGIGIFFSQYKNHLNVVLSGLESVLSQRDAKQMLAELSL